MRIYLDSSVYLKGFIEEERSDIVEKVFDRCKEGRLTVIISIWTLSECISVLDKGVMSNRISSSQMNDILTNMLSYTFNLEREDRLIIVEPNADIIYHSWAFIRWYHLLQMMLYIQSVQKLGYQMLCF